MKSTLTDAPFNDGKISFTTASGPRLVEALILGPLAVHENPTWLGTYNVTHVASGYAVWQGVGLKKATRLIRALQELDWDFCEAKDLPRTTSVEAGRIIRELGL